jgi:hypothetical protein
LNPGNTSYQILKSHFTEENVKRGIEPVYLQLTVLKSQSPQPPQPAINFYPSQDNQVFIIKNL